VGVGDDKVGSIVDPLYLFLPAVSSIVLTKARWTELVDSPVIDFDSSSKNW
jgi:hypothetical protein